MCNRDPVAQDAEIFIIWVRERFAYSFRVIRIAGVVFFYPLTIFSTVPSVTHLLTNLFIHSCRPASPYPSVPIADFESPFTDTGEMRTRQGPGYWEQPRSLSLIPSFPSPTIKAAVVGGMPQQEAMCLKGRLEDKHTTIEAIWPSGIRGCRKLSPIKQLIDIGQHLNRAQGGPGTMLTFVCMGDVYKIQHRPHDGLMGDLGPIFQAPFLLGLCSSMREKVL